VTDLLPSDATVGVDLVQRALSWLAVGLLLFVSLGVIYLSSVEWRDRRRRQAADSRRRP